MVFSFKQPREYPLWVFYQEIYVYYHMEFLYYPFVDLPKTKKGKKKNAGRSPGRAVNSKRFLRRAFLSFFFPFHVFFFENLCRRMNSFVYYPATELPVNNFVLLNLRQGGMKADWFVTEGQAG